MRGSGVTAAGLLVLTFVESFATILVERAGYFYTRDRLGFSNVENLWLALAFGACYVAGAAASHPAARRWGEKRLLVASLGALVPLHAAMALCPTAAVVFAGSMVHGCLSGLKWPVVESYVSAGYPPDRQVKVLGRFNVTWASSVPLALAAAGPLIVWRPWALFAAAAAINVFSLVLALRLTDHPRHLAEDHPQRPARVEMVRLEHLLWSARWIMLASYSCLWILAALMPGIFAGRLGYSARESAGMSGLLDVVRLGAFLVLGLWTAWRGRAGWLLQGIVVLPGGFLLVLFGPNLAMFLAGEAAFGWGAGAIYYAALYYAMVVKNAAVEAGGVHEALIGGGFALGPAAGLLGAAVEGRVGGELVGVLLGAAGVLAACFFLAARRLIRLRGRT